MSSTLRLRILAASPDVYVHEVVASHVLASLPPQVAERFGRMRVAWIPNRSWGQSFRWGASVVHVGHRQGDHLATHPDAHGLSVPAAEDLLRRQVEGTLLHELGHSLLDLVLDHAPQFGGAVAVYDWIEAVARSTPAVSTYRGHCVNGRCDTRALTREEELHEVFAEAFRWVTAYLGQMPAPYDGWNDVAGRVLAAMTVLTAR